MSQWGIRYRLIDGPPNEWRRGRQYRRIAPGSNKWVFWRDVYPSEAVAEHRLRQFHAVKRNGKRLYAGHVFEIKHYPNATHYSPNFSRAELNCKGVECRGRQPRPAIQRNLRRLAVNLEGMRSELGGSLGVLSGYRCPVHNLRVGGATKSQHMTGRAADLIVPYGHQNRYVAAAKTVPAFRNGGIGIYPHGGVHVDRRGWRARWNDWNR